MDTETLQTQQHDAFAPPSTVPVCRRCSAAGGCCCRLSDNDELVAPISPIEWQELLALVPWAGQPGYVVEEANSPAFVAQMKVLFPHFHRGVARVFPLGGSHLRVATNRIGQCAFLGPDGCLLPYSARPAFCQVYPFWFNGDQLQVFADRSCLALREAETIPELCLLMKTTPELIRRHFVRLCQSWGVTPSRLR